MFGLTKARIHEVLRFHFLPGTCGPDQYQYAYTDEPGKSNFQRTLYEWHGIINIGIAYHSSFGRARMHLRRRVPLIDRPDNWTLESKYCGQYQHFYDSARLADRYAHNRKFFTMMLAHWFDEASQTAELEMFCEKCVAESQNLSWEEYDLYTPGRLQDHLDSGFHS